MYRLAKHGAQSLRRLPVLCLGLLPCSGIAAPCEGIRQGSEAILVDIGTAELIGQRIDGLSAYSYDGNSFRKVPVQIDEKNARGDYVLNAGLPFTKDSDDGVFDANDEWVVDASTFGDDFPEDVALGDKQFAGAVGLWKTQYCSGDINRGTLLVVAGGDGRFGFLPEVRFEPTTRTVSSKLYRYTFHPANAALLGKVQIRNDADFVDVIEDSMFVMPLHMPWWLPDLTFRQEDFEGAIESWQEGPLRTIVAVGVKYRAFLSLFKLHLFSELVFYRNRFQVPTVIEFVFDPSRYLSPGSGVAYAIRFPQGRKWQLATNLELLPQQSPRDLAKKGITAAGVETFYAQGERPEASFRVEVKVDPLARQMVPPPYLIEGRQFGAQPWLEHWEWLGELTGNLGLFLDFSNVDAGIYEFGLDLFLSPGAHLSLTDYGSTNASWQRLR